MKRRNRSGLYSFLVVLLILVIIGAFFIIYKKTTEDKKVSKSSVEKLYNKSQDIECSDIGVNDENQTNAVLYMIFSKLESEKLIDENINSNDYKRIVKKLLGTTKDIIQFKDYLYKGYKYTYQSDKITRVKAECGDNSYISKLYGYTYNKDILTINISFAYVKENIVYDLNNNKISEYDSKRINSILDKGTIKNYKYEIKGNNYYLKEIY